jgi:hypothetical protein
MYQAFIISVLSIAAVTANAASDIKVNALDGIQKYFPLVDNTLTLNGHYFDTVAEFGKSCRLEVNLTKPGAEYLTIIGEFTPVGTLGDGIYFHAEDDTFTDFKVVGNLLTINQKLSDSFSTWTETTMQFSKNKETLTVILKQTDSLLFFTNTIQKKCLFIYPKQ